MRYARMMVAMPNAAVTARARGVRLLDAGVREQVGVQLVGEVAELDLHVVGAHEVLRLEGVPLRQVQRSRHDDGLVRVQADRQSPRQADDAQGAAHDEGGHEHDRHEVGARTDPLPQASEERVVGRRTHRVPGCGSVIWRTATRTTAAGPRRGAM
jgi:hypothetical protein